MAIFEKPRKVLKYNAINMWDYYFFSACFRLLHKGCTLGTSKNALWDTSEGVLYWNCSQIVAKIKSCSRMADSFRNGNPEHLHWCPGYFYEFHRLSLATSLMRQNYEIFPTLAKESQRCPPQRHENFNRQWPRPYDSRQAQPWWPIPRSNLR